MNDIETLVMNEVRKCLEKLEKSGVGHIEFEQPGVMQYKVDERKIRIMVSETT